MFCYCFSCFGCLTVSDQVPGYYAAFLLFLRLIMTPAPATPPSATTIITPYSMIGVSSPVFTLVQPFPPIPLPPPLPLPLFPPFFLPPSLVLVKLTEVAGDVCTAVMVPSSFTVTFTVSFLTVGS